MPIPAARTSRRDDLMLAALYFAQALPMGLAWLGLPPWLRAHGAGLETIGAVGLTFLPWAFKFIWAAPVERLCMRYGVRPLIFATQAASTLVFAVLAAKDVVADLPAGITLLITLNALCATQDIATDRYAILQRGAVGATRVNTARFVGFTLGMFAGGSGLLFAAGRWGWAAFMFLCALWMLGQALATRFLSEPVVPAGQLPTRSVPVRANLRSFFAKPYAWRLLGIALVFKTAGSSSDSMLKSLYVDRGMGLDEIGAITALNIGLLGLVGAPLGAWLLARPETSARHIAVACGLATAGLLGLLAIAVGLGAAVPDWLAIALPSLQAVADGAASLAFLTLFMRWSVGAQPGTDFTIFLCAESLGGMAIASSAGFVAAALGYALHFTFGSACAGLAMLYAWHITGVAKRVSPTLAPQPQET